MPGMTYHRDSTVSSAECLCLGWRAPEAGVWQGEARISWLEQSSVTVLVHNSHIASLSTLNAIFFFFKVLKANTELWKLYYALNGQKEDISKTSQTSQWRTFLQGVRGKCPD